MKQRKKSACQFALDHFDLHYKPVYDLQWPSIRIALLSKSKYCALVNNFASDRKQIDVSLAELGAHDFIWSAREKFVHRRSNYEGHNTLQSGTEEACVLLFAFCTFLLLLFMLLILPFVPKK